MATKGRIGWLAGVLLLSLQGVASERPAVNPCPGRIDSETEPALVRVEDLLGALRELKTVPASPALDFSHRAEADFRETFDLGRVKTKMEQFYRLLYFIQAHLKPGLPNVVEFDAAGVRKILLASAVFTDTAIPSQIASVQVDRNNRDDPRYTVRFDNDLTKVPLNGGRGFYGWESGRCQFNEALIFYREFGFSLRLQRNGNLIARYFRGVDLFGDFGTRGVIDLDLNYIGLQSVEFYKGTKEGKVTAFVSEEEFKKNDHNPLLRIVTRFVRNTSVQPIDW